MFKLRSVLVSIMLLLTLLFSLIRPAAAYADDGAPSSASDPYFTLSSILYTFSTADCDPVTGGAQGCTNPIQAAIDFLNGTAASSPWFGVGATPDDGNIYAEAGTYTEDVTVNGAAGWNSGANTPASLGIVGAGSGSTVLDGSFVVANMNSFTLSGFTVKDDDTSGNVTSISGNNNAGTLVLSDIIVINTFPLINFDHIGDGIYVIDHAGDILLTNVNSSNNSAYGASLENRAGSSGSVSIQSSSFDSNYGGLSVQSNGDISLSGVSVSNNQRAAQDWITATRVAVCVRGQDRFPSAPACSTTMANLGSSSRIPLGLSFSLAEISPSRT